MLHIATLMRVIVTVHCITGLIVSEVISVCHC